MIASSNLCDGGQDNVELAVAASGGQAKQGRGSMPEAAQMAPTAHLAHGPMRTTRSGAVAHGGGWMHWWPYAWGS